VITAIDTNVLLDILVPNDEFYDASAAALQDAADEGSLVICDIVYAELCVHFDTRRECEGFVDGIHAVDDYTNPENPFFTKNKPLTSLLPPVEVPASETHGKPESQFEPGANPMTSAKQIAANRANAEKSTGPKPPRNQSRLRHERHPPRPHRPGNSHAE
jgi:hypothetical protein